MFYHINLFFKIVFLFGFNICFAETKCNDFLNQNSIRVNYLIENAKRSDTFWRNHIDYLAIILPEFIAESNENIESEISIFKLLNALNYKSVSHISIGPFQMKPLFIYKILCKSPTNIKSISLRTINDNIDTFSSLSFQLVILKKFILLNKKYMLNDNLNSKILKLSALYNGSTKKYSDPNSFNRNFSKIECLKMPYFRAACFLKDYYKLQ